MKKFRFFAVLGSILCALCIFTACKTNALDAPVGLTVDEDFVLTWDEVENARRYKVEIKNVSTGKSTQKRSSKTEYELSTLAEGDYEIRVMALAGSDENEDSKWSETLYYDKGYVSGVVYSLVNNSEYQVIRAGTANGEVRVEAEYHDKPITSIADNAFKSSGRIENVVLGSNIHTIGNNAFYNCSKLTTVELPDTIKNFGESVFGRCRSLVEVNIPVLITEIPKYTFDSCKSLEEIELHENITKIGDSAFSGCSSLKSIEIPDAVTSIGAFAFSNNSSMLSAVIGSGVESIGEYAFYDCKMLDNVKFEGNALTYVGQYAMSKCTALQTLNLPTGVKTLDDCVFMDSSLLLNVSIPTSVSKVGETAFYGTKMYKNAVEAGDTFIYADNWLIGCTTEQKEELTQITIETLKEGVIGIADGVFRESPKLNTIVLPDSIRYIGDSVFRESPNLQKIETLPNSVVSIGDYTFAYCESLYRIILGNGLKTIGSYAFYGCKSLDDVGYEGESRLIPSTVESIGTAAFNNTMLWSKVKAGVVYAGDWVVGYRGSGLGSIKLNDNTRGIADYAFYGCNSLWFVNGLSDVNYIGEAAFGYCEGLRTVTLKRNITKIADYAFYKCSALQNVILPARLTEVGDYAFYKCQSLTEIDFSDTDLEKIGTKAFYDCSKIQTIKFNDDVETIGDYAFYKCNIESLTIPASVKTLGERSFAKCLSMKTLNFETGDSTDTTPNATVTIGKYAFQGCEGLTKIEIPDTVKTIDDYAFYKCVNVRMVTFGNNVEKIGDYAFYGYSLPTELILPESVQSIGSYAFKGWENVTSLIIDGDIPLIKDHAFFGCKKMTIYTSAKNEESVTWQSRWNSACRPVIWNCTFSENNTKVESVVVGEIKNYNALNSDKETQNQIRSPQFKGKNFAGWATEPGGSVVYTAKSIVDAEKGTTLYAIWVDEQD